MALLGTAATVGQIGGPATASRIVEAAPSAQATFDRTVVRAKRVMLGNPVEARNLGHAARMEAVQWPAGAPRDIAIATAGWIEGEGAYRANDIAAAGPLIAQALTTAERVTPGGQLHADLLLSRARLYHERGRPELSLADLQHAYNIFVKLNDVRGQAKALQNIGSIYQDAQDYSRVLYYYRLADERFSNDPNLAFAASNNIANAYFHMRKFREAQVAYLRSLRFARKIQSPLLTAHILANVGDLAIEGHSYPAAADAIAAGLKLAATPAAASWRPMLLGTQAKLEFAQGRLGAAVGSLQAAFAQTHSAATDQSFTDLHLTAYRVYKAVGDEARALDHLEAFRRMDEAARTLAASTNAALMTARFDFVNQNASIATLKAGQLSRDVALTRLRARQSTVIFSSVLALLLVAIIFLFVYLRSVRRNRNEVMQANLQLAQINADLGEALLVKSQFLATTSHEIRTPLNGILGMTQVILADRQIDGLVRDRVALVDSAGRAMRTLVDDILDFAKMDAGSVRLSAAPIDLRVVMLDLVAFWRAQAGEKGIALDLTMRGIDVPLVTDEARLRQVVCNLLSNALKFTLQGGVAVDVDTETRDGSPVVVIAVRDTGIGIPAGALETVFEPFRQLDTTTTRRFGGTGLGLAISRNLARVLGGDITVASGTGGSVFTLSLPYTSSPVLAEATAAPAALLIVSDNPIRRSFLRTALEREFGPSAVCDVADFGGDVAACGAALIVFDVGDDAAGDVVRGAVATHEAMLERPPLVILVPARLAGDAAAWPGDGVIRFIVKPLRIDALAATLRDVIGEPRQGSSGALPPLMVFPSDPT